MARCKAEWQVGNAVYRCHRDKHDDDNHMYSIRPLPFEPEDAAPSDEFVIGLFCPSIIECSNACNCLRDCRNKPHPAIVPTPFPEAGAWVAGFVQGPTEGNPSCHVCGNDMFKVSARYWQCSQCGSHTGCEPVAQSGAGGRREAGWVSNPSDTPDIRLQVVSANLKAARDALDSWRGQVERLQEEEAFINELLKSLDEPHQCEPAADPASAEQWKWQSVKFSENVNATEWVTKADALAYAEHVTNGLREELRRKEKP